MILKKKKRVILRHLIREKEFKNIKWGFIEYLGGIKMGLTNFSSIHIGPMTNIELLGYISYFAVSIKLGFKSRPFAIYSQT